MLKLVEQAQKISWAISLRHDPNFFSSRAAARLLLQGSRAGRDPVVVDHIQKIFLEDLLIKGLDNTDNLAIFVDHAHQWLQNHPTNQISGLDSFQKDYSAGTTQSFDSFYWRHRARRMRCFVGEYFYHVKTWQSTQTPWSFISESDPLVAGDALVVSLPFCDTGNQTENLHCTLDLCDRLNIPVLIDCCYYTISTGINADLDHDCVDTVTFSLSKAFPIANLRIGLRYTRSGNRDGQYLMNSIRYNNSLSAFVGIKLIEKFGCDYIYESYRERQLEACGYFQLEPSQSVIFALGDDRWKVYNRHNLLRVYGLDLDADQFCNRLCLVNIFDNWDIFQQVKNENTH
jgi:hypothetical protein